MIFPDALRRPLQQAGLLISLGLIAETFTLYWAHPTAFLAFAGVGVLLVAAGIGRYLLAVASENP